MGYNGQCFLNRFQPGQWQLDGLSPWSIQKHCSQVSCPQLRRGEYAHDCSRWRWSTNPPDPNWGMISKLQRTAQPWGIRAKVPIHLPFPALDFTYRKIMFSMGAGRPGTYEAEAVHVPLKESWGGHVSQRLKGAMYRHVNREAARKANLG